MLALSGETFGPSMLARSELRDNFFDQDGKFVSCTGIVFIFIGFYTEGKLKNIATSDVSGIYEVISSHLLLPDHSKPAAEFIAACLHLDPEQRPSASELVQHSWLKGAGWCSDYVQP
jgi:serine/threonine-protein kinase SRPK3